MGTLTQRPENNLDVDHDIDVATIFRREDLPEDPLDARKRVLAGVIQGGGNFKREPEARTNAVTVWYQEGYHVDLAVHRVCVSEWEQEPIEHAGVSWVSRDPMEITNWFDGVVAANSPSEELGATVAKHQLRRMVQLLKYFSKSRPSWVLPGGLVITVLAVECYCPDYHRDDQALYNTMDSIHRRLQGSLEVSNPVDRSQKLTYKDEYVNQVSHFEEKLGHALRWLSPLFEMNCTKEGALEAWSSVFSHSYWMERAKEVEAARELGERLRAARHAGSLRVAQSGQLLTSESEQRSVPVPDHRFYGDDG
jgi:hypothetical protein